MRPLTEKSFEIVAGARRFRAAKIAEVPTVPVRIVSLSDAEALEAQLIENLQRRDVHPLEEAHGFRALLNLDEPKYSVEQIAAKTGKSPAYVTTRIKLTELSTPVVDAFYEEEIGVRARSPAGQAPARPAASRTLRLLSRELAGW